MIVISNFPFPPSVNEMYETNVHKAYANGSGVRNIRVKTSRRRSRVCNAFYATVEKFNNLNRRNLDRIALQVKMWIKDGHAIGLDCYVLVEHSRIWTKDGMPKSFDADNRRKALQDAVCELLGIDDKWVFCGNTEKVACQSKDSECAVIKIYPVTPKSLKNDQHLNP